MGPQTPTPPPLPPKGATGQKLVAKGATLRSPWAPKAPDTPWAPKAQEGIFCPLCTQTLMQVRRCQCARSRRMRKRDRNSIHDLCRIA